MGAIGPGTATPKITIDVEFWSQQSPSEIIRAIQNRSDYIHDYKHKLVPGNTYNAAYALQIQRWKEERRVLQSFIKPREVASSLDT